MCDAQVDSALGSLTGQTLWYRNATGSRTDIVTSWGAYMVQLQNKNLVSSPTEFIHILPSAVCADPGHETDQPQITRCADRTAVDLIWSATLNGRAFTTNCAGTVWRRVTMPDGSAAIVLNNTLSPWTERFALGVTTKNYTVIYPEWTQSAQAAAVNISVQFTLLHVGQITCAALLASASPPSSSFAIANAATAVTVSVSDYTQLQGSLVLEKLKPSTVYVVYCFTSGFWDGIHTIARSPITNTLAQASVVQTAAAADCQVKVSVPFTSLARGRVSPAFTVAPVLPARNLTVIPVLTFVGAAYCDSAYSQVPFVANGSVNAILAPSRLRFDDKVSKDIFFAQSLRQGCYALTFSYSGDTDVMIRTIFSTPVGSSEELLFLNSTVDASTDVYMQSAQFSSDGLQLEIRFSAATDSGASIALPAVFVCNAVFDFPAADQSKCWFETNTLIRASLPSAGILPQCADEVKLLPNKIRPSCVLPSGAACLQPVQDFVRGNVLIINAVNGPFPLAGIAAPIQVPVGTDLTLDTSPSRGNGGRNWDSIVWAVAGNDTQSTFPARLQAYLNNGTLAWFNCLPRTYSCNTIPGSFLNTPGIYNFRVTLRNFVGRVSTASLTIQVLDKPFIPSIHVYSPSFAVIETNISTVIRSVISIDEKYCSATEIAWLVYENGAVQPNLISSKSTYKDPRTLVIDPYVLIPGSEYRFTATVICGEYSAYAEVTRLVAPCAVVPIISNGNTLTISLTNPLVLDASASYLSCSTAGSLVDDLSYVWTCVQRYPLNGDGCDRFHKAVLAMQYASGNDSMRSLVFSDPSAIFSSSSTYLITLRVTSNVFGITGQVSQTINTLGTVNIVPALEVDNPAMISIDGSFRYKIDAFVRSTDTVLAEWKLVATNETLSSRLLYLGNNHYFPAIIMPTSLQGRASFVFRLRAMTITGGCSEFACMPAAAIATTQIRVYINQPPTLGGLVVYPRSGDENTVFTISAMNWEDENLPLFFAFYQSTNHTGSVYNLIRHRMQLPYMSGQLVASDDKNTSISIRAYVTDNFRARTEIYATVHVKKSVSNLTALITASEAARVIAANQHNPEIVLPGLNSLVVSSSINCSSAESFGHSMGYCSKVVLTGTGTIKAAMDKYNSGLNVISGLATYLRSLGMVASSSALVALEDLMDIYDFLSESMRSIGFSSGDGTELMFDLLESCDALVALININSTATSNALVSALTASVNDLALGYFKTFPFGFSQSYRSSNFFNVSAQKGYWEDLISDNSHVQLTDDILLSGSIFKPGSTSSYSTLVVGHNISHSNSSTLRVTQSKYIEVAIAAQQLQVDGDIAVSFGLAEVLMTLTELQPVTHRRDCNSTTREPVICTAEETYGAPYTFPHVACSNDSYLIYTCPVYRTDTVCLSSETNSTWLADVDEGNATVICRSPLSVSNSTSNDVFSVILAKATYSYGQQQVVDSESSVLVRPGSSPSSQPAAFERQQTSFIAFIAVGLVGIGFAIFVYYRVKASAASAGFAPVLPNTTAEYVGELPVVDVDTEMAIPAEAAVVDAGDVQLVTYQAVARPVADGRSDRSPDYEALTYSRL